MRPGPRRGDPTLRFLRDALRPAGMWWLPKRWPRQVRWEWCRQMALPQPPEIRTLGGRTGLSYHGALAVLLDQAQRIERASEALGR